MAGISHNQLLVPSTAQVVKRTLTVLTFFFICDIFNFLTGLSFLCYGTWAEIPPRQKYVWAGYGKGLVILGFLSGACNIFARIGVRIWSRAFLVPYIIFLMVIFAFFLVKLSRSVSLRGNVKEEDFVFFIALIIILYIWQTIVKQWVYMSLPKPVLTDTEAPASSASPPQASTGAEGEDESPPKYESLEGVDELPNYDEAVGGLDMDSK